MKTDYQRIWSLLMDCFYSGVWAADLEQCITQANLTVAAKLQELTELLDIVWENGEIIGIYGRDTP